ncbi:hypothetical protein [Pareuzebyella sediminis]|nr:hypothetical protein [Pareuzebyella sediminis]
MAEKNLTNPKTVLEEGFLHALRIKGNTSRNQKAVSLIALF